jgi:hypothetical protein
MDNPEPPEPSAVFAKTEAGLDEIQSRQLGLPPLVRRLLVLVDGRRTVAELAAFAGGKDAGELLQELLRHRCIAQVRAAPAPAPRPPAPAAPASSDPLAALPPPEQRSPQQLDMARNFMINTINRMLEQNSRLTLVEAIFASPDAATLRTHHAAWEAAIGSSWMGARRLPELRKKLFEVL